MPEIAIIDYGVGNLRSVEKAFLAAGCDAVLSADPAVLSAATRLVLPGVGAFAACVRALRKSGLDQLVFKRVAQLTPLLGICVGMQMLFESSEEFGAETGLGLLAGTVRKFPPGLRLPHVGWNQVTKVAPHALLEGIEDEAFFYFVHSYYCAAADSDDAVGCTDYGVRFTSIAGRGNIFGVQFHPEKSQDTGLRLLANFARL